MKNELSEKQFRGKMLEVKTVPYSVFSEYITQKRRSTTPFLSPELFIQLSSRNLDGLSFLSFEKDKKIVGVCFIGSQRLRAWLPLNTFLLNQTGKQKYDQTWIEYNDILCDEDFIQECSYALLNYLKKQRKSQIYISMTTSSNTWQKVADAQSCKAELIHCRGFRTNLAGVRDVSDILQKLSSNTRAKIKRSIKILNEKYGALCIETATEDGSKIQFYEDLAQLHIEQWSKHSDGSGFSNSHFYNTHKSLLFDYPSFAQIKRVRFGDVIIGYALYFIVNKIAFFYCSGIEHRLSSGKVKPGYVLHCCLMADFAVNEVQFYDFMGGESQYKKSLSDEAFDFSNITITLPTLSGKILILMKKLKKRFQVMLCKKQSNFF